MANTKIKGLTVEIGGDTTKLGKALADVDKKSRDLSGELGEINKLLKLDPKNAELLAQKQRVLAEAVENTSERLRTLKEAEKQVQEQFKRGEVSEAQLRELQREIVATEGKLKGYEKASKETSKAMQTLTKVVDKVKDASGKMGKALAEAAGKGLKAVTTAATAAAGGMAAAAVSAAHSADEIKTLSTVTGISTDDLQAFSYAAGLVDVDLDTLTKSMAKNVKSMSNAANGSKQYADAYAKLGISVTDANGNLRDSETVYWEAIDALGKMENETERDALAMQLFGKSAQELNPLIEAGSEQMKALTQEAKDVGAVMSEETLDALGSFDDSMERLKGSVGAAKNALGGVLLPELQMLTGAGTDLLNEFTTKLNASGGGLDGLVATIGSMEGQITEVVTNLATQLVEKVATLAPKLAEVGMSLIGSLAASVISMLPMLVTTGVDIIVALLNGLTTAIPVLTQALVDMLPKLVDALVTGIPQLIQGALQLFLAILDAIPKLLPPLIAALPQIVMSVIDALLVAIPQLIQGALQFLLAIIDAIPLILPPLIAAIPLILSTLILGLMDCIPMLLDASVTLMLAIVDAIPLIITELIKALPQIGKTMINYYKQLPGKIWEILKSLVTNIAKWGTESRKKAKEGAKKIFTAIVDTIKQLPSKMLSAGKDLVRGLWNGINGAYDWLKKKIKGWVGNVTDFLLNLFGIHSPSRVTAYMGEMLDRGLAEGIEDNTDVPTRAMSDMSSAILDEGPDGLALTKQINHSFGAGDAAAFSGADMLGKLDAILAAIQAGQVIALDGKTLIGSTAAGYDSTLGQRRMLAARGAL